MRIAFGRTILALGLTLALPAAGWAAADDVDGPDDCQRAPVDFGDAPEGVQAYPGVIGAFPTCLNPGPVGTATSDCGAQLPPPGPAGFVRHIHPAGASQYWLGCGIPGIGPMGIDGEPDAKVNDNGGPASACNPLVTVDSFETPGGPFGALKFGQDESYGGTDACLTSAPTFITCTPTSFTFTAYSCGTARAFLNILVDWNHDGDWNDEVACPALPAGCLKEWVVQNVAIALNPGCNTITTPSFFAGPTAGPAWMRISISDEQAPPDFSWNGTAGPILPNQSFTNGETEDYPVTIKSPPPGCFDYEDWGDAPEGVAAYPGGVIGHFPTCNGALVSAGTVELSSGCPLPAGIILPGPGDMAGFVRHVSSATNAVGYWLGCGDGTPAHPGVDSEKDGKVNDTGGPNSACLATQPVDGTEFLGMTWGQDETYGDLDAGLTSPTNLIFKTCTNSTVDFTTFNCRSQSADAFLNILVDMNQDGDWNDGFLCDAATGQCAYEWAVRNVPITVPPGCQVHTSPSFLMGPNEGLGWLRITLTSSPVPGDFAWRGSAGPGGDGFFTAGETEDYPVAIRNQNVGVGDQPDLTQLAFAPLVPNPANGQVLMRFTLPRRSDVSLAAYDVAGRKLAEIASGSLEAGEHRISWDFTDRQGHSLAAGYYLVKLRVGDRVLTQRGMRVR